MRFSLTLSVLCALAAISGHAVAQTERAESTGPHDLPALLSAAEAHYPALRGADAAIAAARARLSEAQLSPFFQFRLTAGLGLAPEARGTPIFSRDTQLPLQNAWQPTAHVGVRGAVPLYTFGRIRAAQRAAEAGLDAARTDRTRQIAQLRYDVRRAYVGLQLALDTMQMISEGQRHLRRAQTELAERLQDGDEDADEVDAWRLAAANAEISARRSQALSLEAVSRATLSLLTGIQEPEISDCPLTPIEHTLDEPEAYLDATENGPEARMLAALVTAREQGVRATRAEALPQFGIGLSASHSFSPGITDQTNPFVSDPANRTGLTAGLLTEVSLDIAGGIHRVRRARARLGEATANRDEALIGLRIRTSVSFERLADATRRVEAWSEGHAQTRAWFISAAQGYQVGTSDADDLIDATGAYFNARFNHLQAIHDHNLGVANLERTAGVEVTRPAHWHPTCE